MESNGIQVQVNTEQLAKAVIDQLATSTVGSLISGTIKNFVIKREDVESRYRWAVDEVIRKTFLQMLEEDKEFKKEVRSLITAQLTDNVIKASIKALEDRLKSYY